VKNVTCGVDVVTCHRYVNTDGRKNW